jgi:hypothetical protein
MRTRQFDESVKAPAIADRRKIIMARRSRAGSRGGE